jgi:putative acetyltransferase
MIQIREEKAEDFRPVYRVVAQAFEREDEAKLVEKLRNAEFYFSMVAENDREIVAHIAFTPVTLEDQKTSFLGLAPLSVAPEFQKQGIGSRLTEEALKICAAKGFTAVFVLGHPQYYPRFGFETAKFRGFSCEYPSPAEAFMVLEFEPGALEGKKGLVKYCPQFAEG